MKGKTMIQIRPVSDLRNKFTEIEIIHSMIQVLIVLNQ